MNKRTRLLIFLLGALCTRLYAQHADSSKDTLKTIRSNPLEWLKKSSFEELNPDSPLMIDGITIPVYAENLEPLKGEALMKVMMSQEFIPTPYVDQENRVKAFVLRKATDEERSHLMRMERDFEERSPMIGKTAVPFDVTDIAGSKFTLAELKENVIVMNFWFVECKPCVMEIPNLNKLVEKYNGKGVVFLGFANNDKATIEKFLTSHRYDYHIVPHSMSVAKDYSVSAFPTHVVIDKESRIVHFVTGLGPETMDELDGIIGQLTR